MNKILDTINPYLIYVPVISTAKGLYQLLSKDVAVANLTDKNISVIDPHEKAKIAISIIPILGNFIVGIMNIAERFFPAKVNPRKDSQIPEGYELVKSDEVKTLDERFQTEIRAATLRGVESARLVVKSELEKEHQAEIDGLKVKHEAEMKAMIENQSRIPEGFRLVNEAEDARILAKLQSDIQASALKGFHAALEQAQKNGDIEKLQLLTGKAEAEKKAEAANSEVKKLKAEIASRDKSLADKDARIKELLAKITGNSKPANDPVKDNAADLVEEAAKELKRAQEEKDLEAKKEAAKSEGKEKNLEDKNDKLKELMAKKPAFMSDAAYLIGVANGGQ